MPFQKIPSAQAALFLQLGRALDVFDVLPDVVFFVKDRQGRYVAANQTLLNRCGLDSAQALHGKLPQELFPMALAARFQHQDAMVLEHGRRLHNVLETHWRRLRTPGWCLSSKMPVRDAGGEVIGLVGLSRDLDAGPTHQLDFQRIAQVAEQIRAKAHQGLTMQALAEEVGLSLARVERHFRRIFGQTPRQMMVQTRLEEAMHRLSERDQSVTGVALACGYQDHSAFSRAFKAWTGLTPSAYRQRHARRRGLAHEQTHLLSTLG